MLLLEPPFPFLPAEYRVKAATDEWERRAGARLRRDVFCEEQKIFSGDDGDDVDRVAVPIIALACVIGMPDKVVGTVRIHELTPGTWQGSRLAVERDFRGVAMIGSELIRHAVGMARARGCRCFLAHVQAQNAPLFRKLNWRTLEEVTLHDRPHHLMRADLAHYPPRLEGEVGFVTALRHAA